MVGAAIGLATTLLLTGLAQVLGPQKGWAEVAVTVTLLLPVGLLGLLPGVRDLEVTAARTLLGVRTELVLPERPTGAHRWRTVLTVLVHLVLGLAAGLLLVGGLPALTATVVAQVRGEPIDVAGWRVATPPGVLGVLVTFAGVAVVLLLTWALAGSRHGSSPACSDRAPRTGWRWRWPGWRRRPRTRGSPASCTTASATP